MSTKSQIKIGVSLNYLLMLVSNIAGFLMVPLIIKMVGDESYGLYELIGGFAGYMAVLDFGVNSTITRYVAKFREENKEDQQKNFLSISMILYGFLAVIVLIIGFILWLNMNNIYRAKFTAEEIDITKKMLLVVVANVAISLPLRTFGAVLNGYEKFAIPRLLHIGRVVIRIIAVFILLSLGYGVITIVVVDAILNITVLLVNMFYVLGVLKVKIQLEKFDTKLMREIFLFSLPIFLTMVYDQIFWKVDQLLVSFMLGAAAIAVVGAAMRLVLIFMRFSTSLSEVFLPRVTKMVVNKASDDDLTDLMIKVGRIQLLLLGVILSGYMLFGQNLIALWIGRADGSIDTHSAFLIGAIIMLPLTLPLIQNTGISILVAKNKHKFRSTVYFIIAVLNIGLTIVLIKAFGIIGASIATAIALTLGNGIIINIYYSKVIGLKIGRFFKECVGRLMLPIIVASGFGYLILRVISVSNSWINLFLCCFIYLIIYLAVMWIMGMNSYEKDMVHKLIRKATRRGAA